MNVGNIMKAIEFLKEAAALYQELQSSGVLADIEASVAKDIEIVKTLEGNQKFKDLAALVEGAVEHKAP